MRLRAVGWWEWPHHVRKTIGQLWFFVDRASKRSDVQEAMFYKLHKDKIKTELEKEKLKVELNARIKAMEREKKLEVKNMARDTTEKKEVAWALICGDRGAPSCDYIHDCAQELIYCC